ncbi:MAG: adenylate kinase family protein [Candidatus Thorarchaeota archaeon]
MPKNLIVIGGTPCTGKTSVTSALAKTLGVKTIQLGKLSEEKGCIKDFDKSRDTGIIDEDCLVEAIIDVIDSRDDRLIIEGHYIDLVPSSEVKIAVILRTHPEILKKRLTERKYSVDKIEENVESEVFGVCQMDAIQAFGEDIVIEIDTSELSIDDVVSTIIRNLEKMSQPLRFDWMSLLEEEGRLGDFVKSS